MPELERWVLHRIWELDKLVRDSCENFEFHTIYTEIHNFCALDLSAFYLDIRKDCLYCDTADNMTRRASRTILNEIFKYLTAWCAPFICFTAEEAWLAHFGNESTNNSVHLRKFPSPSNEWCDHTLFSKWTKIRTVRRVVTGALEIERAEKRIGSSLEAHPTVYTTSENIDLFDKLSPAEIFITSNATLTSNKAPSNAFVIEDIKNIAVLSKRSTDTKCSRCYQFRSDVGKLTDHPSVCIRCAKASSAYNG